MANFDIFGEIINEDNTIQTKEKYTKKIETPIYEPSNKKPHILELVDSEQTKRLIREIDSMGGVNDIEKKFLKEAAHRFSIFNFSKIADYYAHSNKEMQSMMEKLALVIIDYDKSIEYGFTKLTKSLEEEWVINQEIKRNRKNEK